MNPPITIYGPQDDCLILREKTAPENLSLYGSRFIKSLSQLWFWEVTILSQLWNRPLPPPPPPPFLYLPPCPFQPGSLWSITTILQGDQWPLRSLSEAIFHSNRNIFVITLVSWSIQIDISLPPSLFRSIFLSSTSFKSATSRIWKLIGLQYLKKTTGRTKDKKEVQYTCKKTSQVAKDLKKIYLQISSSPFPRIYSKGQWYEISLHFFSRDPTKLPLIILKIRFKHCFRFGAMFKYFKKNHRWKMSFIICVAVESSHH
jgi:hypothetical protein